MDDQNKPNQEHHSSASDINASPQRSDAKPHSLFSSNYLLILILIVIVLFILIYAGVYLLASRGDKTVPPKQNVQPTQPSPTQTPEDTNANWKTYSYQGIFSLSFPATWKLRDSRKNYLGIFDNNTSSHTSFEIIIHDGPPYKPNNPTDAELINAIYKYWEYSTSGLGDLNPQEINRQKIIVSGKEAVEYTIKLTLPPHASYLPYDQVTRVYVIYNQKVFAFRLDGSNQELLKQILSTFKFLDKDDSAAENMFCGGIAAIQCPSGYSCKLDGNYPDAGGTCVADNPFEKYPPVVKLAFDDLDKKLRYPDNAIKVVSVEGVEWNNSSLGCPKPGFSYLQVITPGYKVVFSYNDKQYTYHTNKTSNFIHCDL